EGKKLRWGFDSGAETSLISNSIPKKALQTVRIAREVQLTGSTGNSFLALGGTLPKMWLDELEIQFLPVVVCDLSPMSSYYDINIDGMLGVDFLIQHTICLDFVNQQIAIYL
ncbi:MAG: retropepsin-like domain-containing protein, partial [Flavobacteriales bacterium]|nr:retropepsin-like domain-containing protein [Flavobacteriales bacterium]